MNNGFLLIPPLLLAGAQQAWGIEAGPPGEWTDRGTGTGTYSTSPHESPPAAQADVRLAQFQLPPPAPGTGATPADPQLSRYPERPVISRLQYQFSYGSESDLTYRRNRDLDRRLRDNSLIAAPQVNGAVVYRPSDRLEMMLEAILEREFAIEEQRLVTLPSGATQPAPRRRTSLPIDQAWVSLKEIGPVELTVGRRNYEDERHWLYDTSLDTILARVRAGLYQAELSYSRKDRLDLDLLAPVQKTRIDTYMAYLSYRGIEDLRLAGYAIRREDQAGQEGKPLLLGVRALGNPSDRFNYWTELAVLRGKDETNRRFKAHGFDVGGTYRFPDLPYAPNFTLGYAYGSGDGNPGDNRNNEFRQTGLQSNEARLGGIPKLKYYGEALDPELSNLQIFTLGAGFRPAPTVSVDLVFHRYRTNKLATELRNAALTAEMNQDESRRSNRVGDALDIVVGIRNLFGVRRLGLDLRAGLFVPKTAFRNGVTTIDPASGDEITTFRKADKSVSFVAKFWY